jgi:hypothetical protein
MSYDALDDVVWIGGVGQDRRDELDILSPGATFQWSVFEGTLPGYAEEPAQKLGVWTGPVLELGRDEAHAVIGGAVYRGQPFPELWGKYIFADFHYGSLWALSYQKSAGSVVALDRERLLTGFLGRLGTITRLGFDAGGNIYLLPYGEASTLYRLERNAPSTNLPPLLSATGASRIPRDERRPRRFFPMPFRHLYGAMERQKNAGWRCRKAHTSVSRQRGPGASSREPCSSRTSTWPWMSDTRSRRGAWKRGYSSSHETVFITG